MIKSSHLASAFFLLIIAFPILLQSQDGVFSQYYANRLLLNPALTGLDEGMAGTVQHRSQWFAAGQGYQTYSACLECRDEDIRSGVGLYATQHIEGPGKFKSFTAGATYAYSQPLSEKTALSVGINAAFMQQSLNVQSLIFSDQIAVFDGVINTPTAAPLPLETRSFADFGVGLGYRGVIRVRSRFGEQTGKRDVGFVSLGASINHINEPDESLLGLNYKLPYRLTIHGGLSLPFLANWLGSTKYFCTVSLFGRYQQQGPSRSTMLGVAWLYHGWEPGLFVHHRALPFQGGNTDHIIVSLGWETKIAADRYCKIQLSYDIDTGGLRTAAGGAYEFSLKFREATWCKLKNSNGGKGRRGRYSYKCPSFGNEKGFSRQH